MNKTILITGSTDGIGLLTAKKLSILGNKILLHGRNKNKLIAISKMLNNAPIYEADFSDMAAVEDMSQKILLKNKSIDVLINNAGILKTPNTKTIQNRDIRFDVNTLAPYILTNNLLPIIPKTGMILNLSSAAQASFNISSMSLFVQMESMTAYSQSKLAITIWSQEMARKHPLGPAFISINPGSLLATKMVKEGFGIEGKNINIGADILVKAATDKTFFSYSGAYYDNDIREFSSPHQLADNRSFCNNLMEKINSITQKYIKNSL